MNATPLRLGLPLVPRRMRALPVNAKGYPVPWFVGWIDGVPDFRVLDPKKFIAAIKHRRCWLCGEQLGKYQTFVLGPMCAISRTSSEPPCHHDCATFAAMACPFLVLPKAKRRTANLPDHPPVAGFHIERNPGAMALWTTSTYKTFNARDAGGNPGILIEVGEPHTVEWYSGGAACGRAPVMESIDSGLHFLWAAAKHDGIDGMVALENQFARALTLVPP